MTVQQWVFECLRGKGGAGKGCLRSNVVPQLDEGLHLVEGRPVLDAASKVPEHDGCVVLEVGDADRAQPASIVILHRQGGHVSPRQNHESLGLGSFELGRSQHGQSSPGGLEADLHITRHVSETSEQEPQSAACPHGAKSIPTIWQEPEHK